MSREDQRLMLVGSALTGILAQHVTGTTESGNPDGEPLYRSRAELANAAQTAVEIADFAMKSLGARIPDKLDVYECLSECWAFLESVVEDDSDGYYGTVAAKLLGKQRGTPCKPT